MPAGFTHEYSDERVTLFGLYEEVEMKDSSNDD